MGGTNIDRLRCEIFLKQNIFLMFLCFYICFFFPLNLTGGIFDCNGNETEEIFKGAIRYTNEKLNYNYYLMDVTSVIEPGQESMLSTKLCSILDVCWLTY